MIPFRPTLERVWASVHGLRSERRDERGYVLHMGPELWADLVVNASPYDWSVDPRLAKKVYGLPVEIDPKMPRGWIALRHEITR